MKKAVIIGGGPSGLTAALELLEKGGKEWTVLLLEQSGSFGGISRTVRYEGNRMDIGGHRFFSKDERVMEWWKARMPLQGALSYDDKKLGRTSPVFPGGPDPEREDKVMLVRNRVSRIFYEGKFFDYPISMKWATLRNLGFITTMKVGFSYLWSCVHKLPDDTLENFYINRFGRVLYAMFFESYTEKVWGRHPRDISSDWGAQRVKGLSIRAVLKDIFSKIFGKKNREVETSLIEQFYYPKFGPGQLWEQVAAEVQARKGTIRLNCRATGFTADENHILQAVIIENEQGEAETIEGDAFFSTMPIKDLVPGLPGAPPSVGQAAHDLPYRDFVTVGLLVPRLNLKNETSIPTLGNIVPDCWIYVQDANVSLGRIQIFNNWSPYMLADPEHTVWIGLEYFAFEGDAFWQMEEEACVDFALNELKSMGILNADTVPLAVHRERVVKAYPAYFDSYSEIDAIIKWLDAHPNLYCLGRNGQHRYNNMDHSMATAFEAVENLLSGKAGKANIWQVNTEQSYHETKQKSEE